MRVKRIQKPSGRVRKIYCPSAKQKRELRNMISGLNDLYTLCVDADIRDCVHGFVHKRSPVTNALQHVGYQHTLSFDLRDFFDHVTPALVSAIVPLNQQRYKPCFPDGAARQGLPTSPVLANIAASGLDLRLLDLAEHIGGVYTRYADDLTISVNSPDPTQRGFTSDLQMLAYIQWQVENRIKSSGFVLAPEKTRIQHASHGRRIITGIAVDDAIHATRRSKRKLRAAIHHGNTCEAIGIHYWNRLLRPDRRKTMTIGEMFGIDQSEDQGA